MFYIIYLVIYLIYLSYLILSCLVLSYLILSYRILSYLIYLVIYLSIFLYFFLSYLILSYIILSYPIYLSISVYALTHVCIYIRILYQIVFLLRILAVGASSLREAFDSERENFARQHLDATGPTRPGALGLHLVGNDHPPFVGHIRVYIYIFIYIYICICVCVMDVMQSNVK